jgi:hypothetical protein
MLLQVEEMRNAYNEDKNAWRNENTNIMVDIVIWNCLGCSLSLFIFFFDVMIWMVYAQERQNAPRVSVWNMTAANSMFAGIVFVIVAIVIIAVGIISATVNSKSALNLALVSILLFGYNITSLLMLWMESGAVKQNNKTEWAMRKNIMFWIHCVFATPFLTTCINMVLQRRDLTYNACTIIISFCLGICALGIEYIQDALTPMKECALCPDIVRKKNLMIKIVLISVAVILVLLVSPNSPVFPASSFSNLYYLVLIVPVISAIPIFTMTRYLQKVFSCAHTTSMHATTPCMHATHTLTPCPCKSSTHALLNSRILTCPRTHGTFGPWTW